MGDALRRMILIFLLVGLPAWCFIGYALYSTVKERRRHVVMVVRRIYLVRLVLLNRLLTLFFILLGLWL